MLRFGYVLLEVLVRISKNDLFGLCQSLKEINSIWVNG